MAWARCGCRISLRTTIHRTTSRSVISPAAHLQPQHNQPQRLPAALPPPVHRPPPEPRVDHSLKTPPYQRAHSKSSPASSRQRARRYTKAGNRSISSVAGIACLETMEDRGRCSRPVRPATSLTPRLRSRRLGSLGAIAPGFSPARQMEGLVPRLVTLLRFSRSPPICLLLASPRRRHQGAGKALADSRVSP